MISSDIADRLGNYSINNWCREDAELLLLQAIKEAEMPIPFTRGDVEDAFFRMVNKSNEKPDRSERFDKVMEFRLVAMKLVGVDLQKLVDTLPTRQMREYTNLRTSVLTELFRPPASLQPKPRRGGGLFAGLRW